jgi:hypothetical protein
MKLPITIIAGKTADEFIEDKLANGNVQDTIDRLDILESYRHFKCGYVQMKQLKRFKRLLAGEDKIETLHMYQYTSDSDSLFLPLKEYPREPDTEQEYPREHDDTEHIVISERYIISGIVQSSCSYYNNNVNYVRAHTLMGQIWRLPIRPTKEMLTKILTSGRFIELDTYRYKPLSVCIHDIPDKEPLSPEIFPVLKNLGYRTKK